MALLVAPHVVSELDQIWSYVAEDSGSPSIADSIIDSITSRFLLLTAHPHLGRSREKDLRPGLRSFPAGSYNVFYKVRGEDVLILHVAHGRRDIESFLDS